jgi:hypothetical protein
MIGDVAMFLRAKRTICSLKRCYLMQRQLLGLGLVHLLAGAMVIWVMITVCMTSTLQAKTKKNFSSKLLCEVVRVGCVKKTSKARSSKRSTPKSTTKRPKVEAASVPKRKATSTARPSKVEPRVARASTYVVPKPQRRPSNFPSSGVSSLESAAGPQPRIPLVSQPKFESPSSLIRAIPFPADETCKTELGKQGVDFSVPDHVEGTGQCHVADPVQLKSLHTSVGKVELPGRPLLNCRFARQFTVWLSDIAAPAIAALGEAKVSSLSTGPGYECRGRNGDASAKISEHAFGNAIDIDGITLTNKKRIEISDVADKEDSDYRMLMALRMSACGYFTTVLGPGANAAHASHYHFDLGVHGKSGKYRICE